MLYCLSLEIAFLLAKKHAAGRLEMNSENMESAVDACWDSIKGQRFVSGRAKVRNRKGDEKC